MIKSLLAITSFLLVTFQSFSQRQGAESIFASGIQGCYLDYYISFHERGALEVPDGEHETVLVVINQGKSECYMAKANVKDGKLVAPVSIQKSDGTYVPISRIYRALDQDWLENQDQESLYSISDGMTQIFQTQDKYFLRMFFHTFIQPDRGGNKRAPSAKDLLKGGK